MPVELRCAQCGQVLAEDEPLALLYVVGELSHHHPVAACVGGAVLRPASPCRRCGRDRFVNVGTKSTGVPQMCPPCRALSVKEDSDRRRLTPPGALQRPKRPAGSAGVDAREAGSASPASRRIASYPPGNAGREDPVTKS